MVISVYVLQMVYILICGYVFKNSKRRFLIASFLALFVVMAFRHAELVGIDSATSYYTAFSGIQTADLGWSNPGLPLVMKVIRHFTDDYQWVIIISAAWVCFAYYKLMVKYSENGFISVMWFMGMLFYTLLFDALKQAWAMAFLCFAFDAIFEKKPIRFIVFVGLGALFHFPAIVFLPAYWIAKLKINRMFPIIMIAIFVFVFVFRTQILNWMDSMYGSGESNYSSEVQFIGTKVVFMIILLAYGFYLYFKYNYDTKKDGQFFSTLIYFIGIATVIQTFGYYNNIFERLADYYFHFSVLFVPVVLMSNTSELDFIKASESMKDNRLTSQSDSTVINGLEEKRAFGINKEVIIAIVVTAFSIWRYVSYMVNSSLLSPFYFFWQDVNVSMRFH